MGSEGSRYGGARGMLVGADLWLRNMLRARGDGGGCRRCGWGSGVCVSVRGACHQCLHCVPVRGSRANAVRVCAGLGSWRVRLCPRSSACAVVCWQCGSKHACGGVLHDRLAIAPAFRMRRTLVGGMRIFGGASSFACLRCCVRALPHCHTQLCDAACDLSALASVAARAREASYNKCAPRSASIPM